MFRTSYVHLQEDYIVHATLYGMFFHAFMQAVLHVEGCARYFSLLDCLHKRMENIPYEVACTI